MPSLERQDELDLFLLSGRRRLTVIYQMDNAFVSLVKSCDAVLRMTTCFVRRKRLYTLTMYHFFHAAICVYGTQPGIFRYAETKIKNFVENLNDHAKGKVPDIVWRDPLLKFSPSEMYTGFLSDEHIISREPSSALAPPNYMLIFGYVEAGRAY